MPDPLERLRSALVDRYAIHRELGRGGMAAVYLATDLRNNRRVALKVLVHEVANAVSVARFLREIEIAGAFDHPHILPLLDSGSADGLMYYTMPFVDGESLRQRLRREKQLPLDDAVRISCEVADALHHAHAHGIIHRDIKPDNILLADGYARVADFGIARAMTGGTPEGAITVTGLTIGTPAYMSPEQLAGSQDLDGRSDVYSLGCVLYEMLAGEPPVTGPNTEAVLAKRLREPLPKVTVLREAVPPHIDRAIERALARAPADRFASAGAFAESLRRPAQQATAARPASRRVVMAARIAVAVALTLTAAILWWYFSHPGLPDGDEGVIAVFPFRVHAEDASALYLREGILDYLSAQLTGEGVPRAVDSRSMLYAWRRATEDGRTDLTTKQALDLARRFGAGRVLLGEVVATRSTSRLSGRILDGRGRVLAERTESGSDDPLLLIDRLAGRLLARSAGETEWRLPGLSDSLEAVKEYLAGVQAHRRSEYARAKQHYDRALEIDSGFALAAMRAIRGGSPVSDMLRRTALAWKLRERLSARDRALVEAHFGLGPNYPEMSTMAERFRANERALALNPDAPDVLERVATFLLVYGPQIGLRDAHSRGAILLDSALTLDSSYGPAAQWRLFAALLLRDSARIRHLVALEETLNPETEVLTFRWAGHAAAGDTAGLSRVVRRNWSSAARAADLSQHGAQTAGFTASGAYFRLPLADVEHELTQRLADQHIRPEHRMWYLRALFHIAVLQGRVADALALADSVANRDLVLAMAIAEPGFERAAQAVTRRLDAMGDAKLNPDALCYRELWRVHRGDTARTRATMVRIRELVRAQEPAPIPRVGRFDVCPLLLEVLLAGDRTASQLPALERLERVIREGVGLEVPGELATLVIARARFATGDYATAYDIVRRRPYIQNVFFTLVLPAHLREEGRLAALLGDTTAAIDAYQHYLALRSSPDPGPVAVEVRVVREHLDVLLASRKNSD